MATNNTSKADKAKNKSKDPRMSGDAQPITSRRRVLSENELNNQLAGLTPPSTPSALHQVAAVKSDDDKDLVTVVVSKPFTLSCDDGKAVKYEIGIQDMPRGHATHWFSKAQGVELKE